LKIHALVVPRTSDSVVNKMVGSNVVITSLASTQIINKAETQITDDPGAPSHKKCYDIIAVNYSCAHLAI